MTSAGRGAWAGVIALLSIGLLVGVIAPPRPWVRSVALAGLITMTYAVPQAVLLAGRSANTPILDSVLLTQAAGARLLSGHDPYGHDYIDSASLRAVLLPELPINPVLGQFVYMPGLVLLAAGWRAVSAGASLGWLWIPAQGCLALAARGCGSSPRRRDALMAAAALNPVLLLDYVNLFNDLFYLAPALGAVAFVRRSRPIAAGVCLGLAVAMKQPAVLLAPTVLLAAWHELGTRSAAVTAAASAATAALVVGPFLLAGPAQFLGDVAGYFYASGTAGYPIRGPGLGGVLLALDVIPSRWGSYPAAPIEGAAALVVLLLAGIHLRKRWSWAGLWAWTGVFTLAVFTTGRTSAPNYVDVAVLFFSLAIASGLEGANGTVGHEVSGPTGDHGVQTALAAG